jgi:(p)ppGpp synthase/HD superfamily hydrolase
MDRFSKLSISLRYYLLGKGYHTALKAWDFAQPFHDGFRKDQKTPDYQHQIEVAHYLRTLPILSDPELTFTVAFLHDTPEDKDVSFEELSHRFGSDASKHVRTLSKTHRGVSIPHQVYYAGIATDPLTALVKGADRKRNIGTMVGVFTRPKLINYLAETEEAVIPMLKKARRGFPEYEPSFENINQSLKQELFLIKEIVKLTKE